MAEPFTPHDGNAWWSRNQDALAAWNPADDWPIRLIDLYSLDPGTIIEVGCADGHRLHALADGRPDRRCIGLDISPQALAYGRSRYPDVELYEAPATSIPRPDAEAELVIVYFVFHWLARADLKRVWQEVDRVLAPGGCLLLGDFAPDDPEVVPYKHRAGVCTYKRPDAYSLLFESTGRYREVARVTWNHDTHELSANVPSYQRAAVVLLRKERA